MHNTDLAGLGYVASALEYDVDLAVIDRRIARPGLAYRLLPDHRARDAVLLELVRDDRAACLRQIFVRLWSTRGARTRLHDESLGARVPGTLCGIGDRRLRFIREVRAEFVKIDEKARKLSCRSISRRLRVRHDRVSQPDGNKHRPAEP